MAKKPRSRRTYRELFLARLKQESGDEAKLIGNQAVRDVLGWNEGRYHQIRRQLIGEGLIIAGRGRGGSVGLADVSGEEELNIFISYSQADEDLKSALVKHLEPLKRKKLIKEWHFRKISAGKEWDKEISVHLEAADIVLLLISVDFINSSYSYDVEMECALERQQAGGARVIPIILRNCLWQSSPFAKLQALPTGAKPVRAWNDQDEALTDVADGIRRAAEEILSVK